MSVAWQELVAQLALRLDPLRPGDDHRIGDAALEVVALPHLERRVERPRPADRIVVVGRRRAELVEVRHVLLDRVRDAVEELVLVDRAVRAALAARAVVGDEHDDRVLELRRSARGSRAAARSRGRCARGSRRTPRPSGRRASSRRRRASPTAGRCRRGFQGLPSTLVSSAYGLSGDQLGVGGEDPHLLLALEDDARGTPRSPCRTCPCTCRSTPWARGAGRAWRRGRST